MPTQSTKPTELNTDPERISFLNELDGSEKVELTEWEASFLEFCLKWDHARGPYSKKMVAKIDDLFDKYIKKL